MADYESWSMNDQGFRTDESRDRWRSEGRDWRGGEFRRYGWEDVGRLGREDERGSSASRYRGEQGGQRSGYGSEGYGRAGYDCDCDDWRQGEGGGRYGREVRGDYGRADGSELAYAGS